MKITQHDCAVLDQQDPLGYCRDRFNLAPGIIYLDGNSLGALPASAPARLQQTIDNEWGIDLIQSWNRAGWFDLPAVLGDRIGSMVGAEPGRIVVCDNTSINLIKALHATLGLNKARNRIIAHRGEFPTDLYIIQSAAESCGREISVDLLENEQDIVNQFDHDVAVAVLSQVNYKTGKLLDMAEITLAAHEAGVQVIWDLCHSAGVLPIELDRCEVDFAVGCTYKYLNGGPGAPAYIYAASAHHEAMGQPLTGWWSHSNPFDFSPQYSPAKGIKRMLSGTQPILSLRGVGCGLDTFENVSIVDLREKSVSLCSLFIRLIRQQCAGFGLEIIGPENGEKRGSHVSIAFKHGYPIVQALIEKGIVGDFRAPDLMRFGFAPLYLGYQQIWDAVAMLEHCLKQEVWNDPKYHQVASVT